MSSQISFDTFKANTTESVFYTMDNMERRIYHVDLSFMGRAYYRTIWGCTSYDEAYTMFIRLIA